MVSVRPALCGGATLRNIYQVVCMLMLITWASACKALEAARSGRGSCADKNGMMSAALQLKKPANDRDYWACHGKRMLPAALQR
jgi:hypothetical protein